ncbi:MAG TPA: DUF2970 domain-containing protein [Burkholderiales bacterium]|nr:DUF2970 domain-containing protein [Burkholderiales bacterium]
MPRAQTGGTARKATLLQVAGAVACAFIGIRKRTAHERDALTLSPPQVIAAGLLAAALLVLGLLALVRFITG